MPRRVGDILSELNIGLHFRDYEGLLVLLVFVERKQEGRALAMPKRTCEGAFEVSPLLRSLARSEGVASVEYRIAEHEIQGAMETGRAPLGNDLQPRTGPAAQTAPNRGSG